jgi:hypothetical protein
MTCADMNSHANDSATPVQLPGYDVPAVEAWLRAHVPSLTPPLHWTRLEGGHSNLTYLLRDAHGAQAVIRRPPQGELLPKAHDMGREWALISALGKTPVPVPRALGFCEDPAVTGAPSTPPTTPSAGFRPRIARDSASPSSMCWPTCIRWTRTPWA